MAVFFVDTIIFPLILRKVYADKDLQEAIMQPRLDHRPAVSPQHQAASQRDPDADRFERLPRRDDFA